MVGVIRTRGEVQRAPDEPACESDGADTEVSQPEHSPGIPRSDLDGPSSQQPPIISALGGTEAGTLGPAGSLADGQTHSGFSCYESLPQ